MMTGPFIPQSGNPSVMIVVAEQVGHTQTGRNLRTVRDGAVERRVHQTEHAVQKVFEAFPCLLCQGLLCRCVRCSAPDLIEPLAPAPVSVARHCMFIDLAQNVIEDALDVA